MNINEAIKKAIDGETLVTGYNNKKYFIMWDECTYQARLYEEDSLDEGVYLPGFPITPEMANGWEIYKKPIKMLAQDVLKKLSEFGRYDLNFDKENKRWLFVDLEGFNKYNIKQINKKYNWNIKIIEVEDLKIDKE